MAALAAPAALRRLRRTLAVMAASACLFAAASTASAGDLRACGDAAERERMLASLNALRQQGGPCAAGPAPSLVWDVRLEASARAHAADLVDRDELSHVDSQRRTLAERLLEADYRYRIATENLVSGALGFEHALAIWRSSDKHCANLMHPEVRDVGLACTVRAGVAGGRASQVWVATFAAPQVTRAMLRAGRATLVAGMRSD